MRRELVNRVGPPLRHQRELPLPPLQLLCFQHLVAAAVVAAVGSSTAMKTQPTTSPELSARLRSHIVHARRAWTARARC
jgi:hypothetical protein